MALFWILFLIGIFLEPAQGDNTKLLLVQILFRHGARSPLFTYPTDPNPVDYWKEGVGKLTLLGRKQHYALGTRFREMYKDFITTSPLEVTVNSSDSDRCIRSGLANIAAFYKPSPKWKFDDTVEWQPIPVQPVPMYSTEPKGSSFETHCPQTFIDTIKKAIFLRVRHEALMDNLTRLTGRNISHLAHILLLHDTLEIERAHGLIIPPWAEHYWNDISSLAHEFFLAVLESKKFLKLRIGSLMESIVEDMVKKSAGGIPDIKVRLYSFHDYEVAAVLKVLKLFSGIRPPFCASVVFELHEATNGDKVVRLLYLNSTTPEAAAQEPHLLILDGCSEYCPLDYFVDFAKQSMLENFEEECTISDSPSTLSKWLASVIEGSTSALSD